MRENRQRRKSQKKMGRKKIIAAFPRSQERSVFRKLSLREGNLGAKKKEKLMKKKTHKQTFRGAIPGFGGGGEGNVFIVFFLPQKE